MSFTGNGCERCAYTGRRQASDNAISSLPCDHCGGLSLFKRPDGSADESSVPCCALHPHANCPTCGKSCGFQHPFACVARLTAERDLEAKAKKEALYQAELEAERATKAEKERDEARAALAALREAAVEVVEARASRFSDDPPTQLKSAHRLNTALIRLATEANKR